MLKSTSLAKLKVDDRVEIEEHYPNDTMFYFRGAVLEAHDDSVVLGQLGHTRTVGMEHAQRTLLKVWVQQPDPPTEPGSVVKFYDGTFLRYASAVRFADGWRDSVRGQPVDLEMREWDVLFNAGA